MSDHIEVEAVLSELRRPADCGDFFFGKITPIVDGKPSIAKRMPIIGNLPEDDSPELGIAYRFYGKKVHNEKFGDQLQLVTFVPAKPYGREGTCLYLEKNARHIGRARATELWNKFGPDCLRIAREHPELIVEKINGMNAEKAAEISADLRALESLEGVNISVMELLNGRGFPRDTTRKVVKQYGNRAVEVLSADPFKLLSHRGIGFLRCDAMWMDLGLPPDKIKRQVCCIGYAISSDKEGHTWIDDATVERFLKSKITAPQRKPGGEPESSGIDFPRAIAVAKRAGLITPKLWCDTCKNTGRAMVPDLFDGESMVSAPCPKCKDGKARRWLADAVKAKAEDFLARHLAAAAHETARWPQVVPAAEGTPGLTPHQAEHAARATASAIGILGGSPGTGKTYTVAKIVSAVLKEYGAADVAICAPTGKAAVRCTESMAAQGIGLRATTIHSLLKVEAAEDGQWSFQHRESNPLPKKFIIVDEFSMCDVPLLKSLLSARARGTHILFVGDVNQLPPVGYGAPLRDMIAAGVPYGELNEIKRNAGTIVRACKAIRECKTIPLDREFNLGAEPPQNLVLRTCKQSDAVRTIRERIEALRERGLDPIWDVQIIVAVNKRSPLARVTLNKYLQDLLNPSGKSVAGSPFRVGDKVIVTKNSFFNAAE